MDGTAPNTSQSSSIQDRSLLVLIIDITPSAWSHRNLIRDNKDKKREAVGKKTIGPATLTKDVLPSLLTFLLAYAACHRENALVVLGVAGNDVAVVYPRKGVAMERMVGGDVSSEGGGGKIHPQELEEGLRLGVMELMTRCAGLESTSCGDGQPFIPKKSVKTAAITAATSQALCIINRFLRSSSGGGGGSSKEGDNPNSLIHRSNQEQGILAMIANRSSNNSKSSKSNNLLSNSSAAVAAARRHQHRAALGLLSPRILVVQSSPDRTADYNAFMNCVFAAANLSVTVDGCFVPLSSNKEETSSFLKQACDRTGGVYSRPVHRSQVLGGLAEIFLTVFLPPIGVRGDLNRLKVDEVDFKATCFETGKKVDMGVVCSLCLSIFEKEPAGGVCLTCGASVDMEVEEYEDDDSDGDGERAKKQKCLS